MGSRLRLGISTELKRDNVWAQQCRRWPGCLLAAAARHPGRQAARHASARANSAGRWADRRGLFVREAVSPCFFWLFVMTVCCSRLEFWKEDLPDRAALLHPSCVTTPGIKDGDGPDAPPAWRWFRWGEVAMAAVVVVVVVVWWALMSALSRWPGQASETISGPRKPYLDSTAHTQGPNPKACLACRTRLLGDVVSVLSVFLVEIAGGSGREGKKDGVCLFCSERAKCRSSPVPPAGRQAATPGSDGKSLAAAAAAAAASTRGGTWKVETGRLLPMDEA
ncbi:hypothetical protein QBC39DRAFT_60745 [Podospora conica]|nr:hypothetical protein QBC39DRAFT_60745 [Schizothecium conicum]